MIALEAVPQIVSRFRDRRVLVVGDVMLDEYVYGEADRISPEAPVPVVRMQNQVHAVGGAANTAHNIATLGGTPLLVGVVGKDRAASALRETLVTAGIAVEGLIIDHSRPTTLKTRIVAHGQQVLRIDTEARCPVSNNTTDGILAVALPLVETVEALVLCDYAKGVATEHVCRSLLGRCAELGKASVVDPKGPDYSKYNGVSVITPNLKEAQIAAATLGVSDNPDTWGAALAEYLRPGAVLVTKGAAGMTLYRAGAKSVDIPARARTIYDVTGAGDTVAATTAVSMAAVASIDTAVWMANVAAGIVVGKAGTSTATADEFLVALDEIPARYNRTA